MASEINKIGEITKLVFTLSDNVSQSDFDKMNTWEVRLGMTSDDEFTSSSTYGPPSVTFLTGTPNFDGNVTLNGKKIEVQLTTPFDYSDTSKNLVVDIVEKNNATNPYSNINLEVFNKCSGYNGCAKKRSAYNTICSYCNDWSSRPSSVDAVPQVTLTFKEETGPYKVTKIEETQVKKGTNVGPGTNKLELLAVNVKVGGKDTPLPTLESLTFDLTADANDVTNLQLWYGTTSDLSQATKVNVTSPFGTAYTLSGINKELKAGSNFFFLTVDVPAGATVGNTIDANFTEIKTTTDTFSTSSTVAIAGNTSGAITIALEPIVVKDNSFFCGTTINSNGPAEYGSNQNWGQTPAPNSWYQMLYTAEDLGYTPADIQSGKKIKLTSIGFYLDCNGSKECAYNTANNQTIYMKLVDEGNLENYKHPDGTNGFQEVFSGDVNWVRPKSKVDGGPGITPSIITLQNEFEFTPNKKLVVYYKNQHGGSLKSCGNADNAEIMPFMYAPNKHNKSAKRNVGGKSFADGSRKESTIFYEMIPITYFGYKPATKKVEKPKIENMPTDAKTCEETAYEIKGVTVDPTDATLEWTGGTGTFANGTTLNATYTPAQGETGEITLSLKATKTGYDDATETFKLTVNAKPKFTSTDTSVKVNETITLTTDIAGGTWESLDDTKATVVNGVVTGKAEGTATIKYTTTEGCEVTQEITVTKKTVADVVIANMPTTTATICQGETYDITGVTVTPTGATLEWKTSGDGNFSSTNTADTVYTPGAKDIGKTVTLTLTAKKDGKEADPKTISLKVNAKPVAKIIKK